MSQRFCTFALVHTHAIGRMGGTATYWKASLMLCFWLFERRKLKSCTKTKAEVNATGVVYTPGVCRGLAVYNSVLTHTFRVYYILTHTFRVYYILTGVGIQILFILSGRLPTAEIAERAGEDTPLFVCRKKVAKNL